MRKLLASLLALTLVISSFACTTFAEDTTTETANEAVKTWYQPMVTFSSASDLSSAGGASYANAYWHGGANNITYDADAQTAKLFYKNTVKYNYQSIQTGFVGGTVPAVTADNELYLVTKIQVKPGDATTLRQRYRLGAKSNGETVTIFETGKSNGTLRASIAKPGDRGAGTDLFDVPDYYGDGWIDVTAVIPMTATVKNNNYPITVYYNGMKKTNTVHTHLYDIATAGELKGLIIQTGGDTTSDDYNTFCEMDNTGVYTVNKANLPALTYTRTNNRFEFSNEVMMGDLTNSSDNTLSTILVDSVAIPLSDITFEKGGLAFTINEKYFNKPGSTTISLRNVKDIFGQKIKDIQKRDIVINNIDDVKTINMPNASFDASSEISRNQNLTTLLTNWYTNTGAGIWHNEDGTMGIFPKDSVEYNTGAYRVFEKFVGVNSAAENQKLVYKIKMYPGGVLSRLRISGIPANSYTITSVGAPMFIGQQNGQLYGYAGNTSSGVSNHSSTRLNITDYYDGWVDAVAVIDVDYSKDRAPVTVYFNGEKHEGLLHSTFMTYAKQGLISAVNLQSEHQGGEEKNSSNQVIVGTGETKVDDNMAYTVFSNNLPALIAENNELDVTFSNEVMRADLIKEGTTSKIKVNGNYISMDDIVIPMGGLNISISEDALDYGENTIDLSEVTDIFGSNVTSGATFTYEKVKPVTEIEEATASIYDDGKGLGTITNRFFATLDSIENIAVAGFEVEITLDDVTYVWDIVLDTVYSAVTVGTNDYVAKAGNYILTGAIGDVPADKVKLGDFDFKVYTIDFEGNKTYR